MMTENLTEEERGWLATCEAATPEPWEHSRLDLQSYDAYAGEPEFFVYRVGESEEADQEARIRVPGGHCRADGLFISAARTALPEALKRLGEARAALRRIAGVQLDDDAEDLADLVEEIAADARAALGKEA